MLGPGSLFTSVLAAAVLPGVARALSDTGGRRVLVLNLGPQAGESQDLGPDDNVRAVRDHGVPFDVVLADPRFAPSSDHGVEVVVRPVGVDDGRADDEHPRVGGVGLAAREGVELGVQPLPGADAAGHRRDRAGAGAVGRLTLRGEVDGEQGQP